MSWKTIHTKVRKAATSDTFAAEVLSNIASYTTLAVCANASVRTLIFSTLFAEYAAFYGCLVFRRYFRRGLYVCRKERRFCRITAVCRELAVEYGIAECLDAFLLRPFFLAVAVAIFPREPVIALLCGGVCTDVLFHATAWGVRLVRARFVLQTA